MVDKLVAKFKKLVNDDKRRLNIEESNEIEDTVIEKPKKKKKLIIDDDEMQNKFNETQKETFVSSEMLTRSERNSNKKFTKSLSESQMK